MEKYRVYASEHQVKILDAIQKHGGNRTAAAKELGMGSRNMRRSMERLRETAAKKGFSPENDLNHPTPAGYSIKGTSTLYSAEGDLKMQWVKTNADQVHILEGILEALDAKINLLPAMPKIKAQKRHNKDLLTLYTFTDYHLGMYSWDKEAGDNWDCDIAKAVLINAGNELMEGSPDSETGLLNLQGDFLHWDGLDAITPSSGHQLDADTRFPMMIELALDLTILLVESLLKKHNKVKVIICEGNHDLAGSAWLQKAIKKIFRHNKRVEVDDSAFPYYAHQHGKIMLGFHHGHKKKNKALPALFASEPRYRQMWGECLYTYIHTGHYHQTEQDMSEEGGAIVERHPTLAARDAYAARGGWVSWRAARAITYHVTEGEDIRISKPPRYPKGE